MKRNEQEHVHSEESIVRLIHQEWVVNGILQQTAFVLRNGENYLSVNRPVVNTYDADVASFIAQHPKYRTQPLSDTYRRAILNVGEVRSINIIVNEQELNVSVDVEPRTIHAKSHAGIFTRIDGKNIKGGMEADLTVGEKRVVSTTTIYQKLRWNLLQL
jgi:hypothetical protein